ncbi:MAG: family 16 glycosylhydrolase [Acholeplasmataceae bacterium]|nr:family 16 glycosylhydrolase [Acholeplasmataceae bacterium]
MKKFKYILMTTLLVFILVGCEIAPSIEPIGEAPMIFGAKDLTLEKGSFFDPYDSITATDLEDGDLTDQIVITGLSGLPINNNILFELGTYELTYSVVDSNKNKTEVTITITILLYVSANDSCDVVLAGYTLTWCDDFTGEGDLVDANGLDLSKWGYQLGTGTAYGLTNWGNNEQQFYRSQNVKIIDSILQIEAKNESFGGKFYTSARLWTKNTFNQKYGRFEALIKLPSGDGLWPAFWLMPQDNVYGGWANSGEIDIMEARGRLPFKVTSAIHFGGSWPDNRYTSRSYSFTSGKSINDFNLYAVEWEETVMRFYVNDVLYHTVTNWSSTGYAYPAPFDQSFYIILNLAVGGDFDGNILPNLSIFEQPVLMEVDYVRVFAKNE